MNKQDWEILDPKIHNIIDDLNKNVKYLKEENNRLNNIIKELKNEIKNTNNIILEQKNLFNDIKIFLEENRKKYTKSFNELNEKIINNKRFSENIHTEFNKKLNENKDLNNTINKNVNDNNIEIKNIKDIVCNQNINDKILDPNYRIRINNLKWRHNGILTTLDR